MSENPHWSDIQHWMRPGTLQLQGLPPLSLYIHLPWCLKKCPYCDFNSHEWSATSAPGQPLPEQPYLDALRADLQAALPLIWGRPIHTVFIGGGTPSLFSPEAVDRLLGDVRALTRLDADAEITLEANPGTFEKDRFKAFRQAGVTRPRHEKSREIPPGGFSDLPCPSRAMIPLRPIPPTLPPVPHLDSFPPGRVPREQRGPQAARPAGFFSSSCLWPSLPAP